MRKIKKGKKIYCKKGSKIYQAFADTVEKADFIVYQDEVWINGKVYFPIYHCFKYNDDIYEVLYVDDDKGIYVKKM